MVVQLLPLHRPPLLLHSVQERLKEFISSNQLNGGDPLPPEGELARQLGVSRNSIREAIKGLESVGVVETKRGVGVFVSEFSFGPLLDHLPYGLRGDLRDVEEFLAVRKALEVTMIEEVVRLIGGETIDELDRILDAMKAKAEKGAGFPAEDERFHHLLFACLGNRVLDRLISVFWQAFHKATSFFDMNNHDPMETYRDHAAIVAALKRRDATRAKEAMALHYRGIAAVISSNKNQATKQGE